jgi:hypothetical protein
LEFKKKGFKSSIFKSHGKISKMSLATKSVYQQNFPSQSGNKPFGSAPENNDSTKREPFKFCGCGEEHMMRDFPHMKRDNQRVYNIHETNIVNDVVRRMPQIYANLDNRQANHLVSILIDPHSNMSYVSPQTVEKCKL